MSETNNSEYDDLEHLIRHPGWLAVKAKLTEYWDTHFADRTRDALNQSNDTDALHKLRQACVARDAVLAALRFPEERLNQLQRAAERPQTSLHRGGY